MFRLLKRRRAVKSFIYKLPFTLVQRHGAKHFYSINEVELALERGEFDKAFSAYAYALFCSRTTFDDYFKLLNVSCTYDGLRKFAAKRFFRGIIDFDAASIIRFAKGVGHSSYYESGLGDHASGTGHSGNH